MGQNEGVFLVQTSLGPQLFPKVSKDSAWGAIQLSICKTLK